MSNINFTNDMICEGPNLNYGETGWICPKCGASLAPSVKVCPYCNPGKDTNIRYENGSNVSCTRDFENGERMIFS